MELKELPNIPGSQSILQKSPLPIEFCEILRRVCQDSSIWLNLFRIAKPYLLVGVVSVPSRHLRRRADAFGEKRRDLLQRVQINWPAKLAWAVSLKIYDSKGRGVTLLFFFLSFFLSFVRHTPTPDRTTSDEERTNPHPSL